MQRVRRYAMRPAVHTRCAADCVDELRARFLAVDQQCGLFAAAMAVSRQHGAQAFALVHRVGVGEAHRATGAHRAASAAAHAQVRLDDDATRQFALELAFLRRVAADGLRRTDVDAGGAANLLIAAVRAQLVLVLEKLGLLEFAVQFTQFQHRVHQSAFVVAGVQVALRRLVHGEGRRLTQIQHKVKVFAVRQRRTAEVDGACGVAHAHAVAVALAGGQVDLVVQANRALGAGIDAGIAAGAQVQVDRVAAVPFGVELTEPARQLRQATGVGGAFVRLDEGAADLRDQHRHVKLVCQKGGRALCGCCAAQHQAAALALVADGGHRLGRRQLRGGNQCGQFGR